MRSGFVQESLYRCSCWRASAYVGGPNLLTLEDIYHLRLSGQAEYRLAVTPHSSQEEPAPTSPLPSVSTTSRPIFLTSHFGSVPPKTAICSLAQGSPNIPGPAECNSSSRSLVKRGICLRSGSIRRPQHLHCALLTIDPHTIAGV